MSAKWRRSLAWDEEFFPRWAWPAKFVLRALSSIWLAVVLLTLVSVYGVLASVPLGMLVGIPTYAFYLLTAAVALAVGAVLPAWGVTRLMAGSGSGMAARFVAGFAALVLLSVAVMWAWVAYLWPEMRWHVVVQPDGTVGHRGVKFFADFAEAYKGTTLRRLPGLEMTELEFYAWWPFTTVLGLFVLNMVTATVRRIEFKFVNLGVLTVHTGIVTIALGSMYYGRLKQEGDMFLMAGQFDEAGKMQAGPPEFGFFDNQMPALWVTMGPRWEVWPIRDLPRYNDYNLDVIQTSLRGMEGRDDGGRTLGLDVNPPIVETSIDPDVRLRVIGYAAYANLRPKLTEAREGEAGSDAQPMRRFELLSTVGKDGPAGPPAAEHTALSLELVPGSAVDRVATIADSFAIEHTVGMSDERWGDVTAAIPLGARHALVVEVPAAHYRGVHQVAVGQEFDVPGGYRLVVERLDAEPQFPIITKGYEGSSSSVAVVRIIGKGKGANNADTSAQRWVYHRFPEITQEMLGEAGPSGMPKRQAADPAIRVGYVDASMVQAYFDERADGTMRAAVRIPGQEVKVYERVEGKSAVAVAERFRIRIGERSVAGQRVDVPVPVPVGDRDRDSTGNHKQAAIALEVTAKGEGGKPWRKVLWLPHSRYHLRVGSGEQQKQIILPGGRPLTVAFGRVWYDFPGFAVRLKDFEMTPYPHSTQPRDFRSDLEVIPMGEDGRTLLKDHVLDRHTSLNNPLLLRVPMSQANPAAGVAARAMFPVMEFITPIQYKLSQVGWDSQWWERSRQMAEANPPQAPRAYARFTILGVGNNQGIYVIAAGAIMMSVGIPWAFYVKPWILKRRKVAIQRALAAAGWKPGQPVPAEVARKFELGAGAAGLPAAELDNGAVRLVGREEFGGGQKNGNGNGNGNGHGRGNGHSHGHSVPANGAGGTAAAEQAAGRNS